MWAHCGIINAQALARDENTESLWFPSEGYCFSGELEGSLLEPITRVQCTWKEWQELHPDTLVLDLPNDPKQKDPREGHGAEEYYARPAMDQIFITSLAIDLNSELPENEPIIGINTPDVLRAYPFHELKRQGGLLHDDLGGQPIIIFTGPEPDSFKAMVFDRRVDGRPLDFAIRDRQFIDLDTESVWSLEGLALSGPHEGAQLTPVHFFPTRWHSWCYTHPGGEIWRTQWDEAPDLDTGSFAPAIGTWRAAGYEVKVERAIINLERPLESPEGYVVRVNGDRLLLHRFENATAADDYCYFHPHSGRRGCVVLESAPDPEFIYTDIATQRVRIPEDVVQWSAHVGNDTFVDALEGIAPGEARPYPGLRRIVEGLTDWDLWPGIATPMNQDVPVFNPMLTTTGRFPGIDNGVYATIGEGDNFVIYRCSSAERAERYVTQEQKYAFAVDRYVFRSIPLNKFKYPRFGAVDRDEDKVAWSDLLEDDDFKTDIRALVETQR